MAGGRAAVDTGKAVGGKDRGGRLKHRVERDSAQASPRTASPALTAQCPPGDPLARKSRIVRFTTSAAQSRLEMANHLLAQQDPLAPDYRAHKPIARCNAYGAV